MVKQKPDISDFDYDLPKELIAQERVSPYEDAKLMVFERNKNQILHKIIGDLPNILEKDDVLVFNNSRVIPARIFGKKITGGKIEILLLRELHSGKWLSLVKPGKSIRLGAKISFFNTNLTAEVVKIEEGGQRIIEFSKKGEEFIQILEKIGEMPTPPYINKKLDKNNQKDYQTCFARDIGSAAAPTAGLHFTPELLKKLKNKGIQTEFVTLHVGLGTFAPVGDKEVQAKKLHSEYFTIDQETADRLNNAKKSGKRIIAVGTTTVRVLESCTDENNILHSKSGETNIFIQPGDKFRFTEAVMTNFHLPKSSLLMLIATLIGREKVMELYETAKENKYRFFSFGDAMLIL